MSRTGKILFTLSLLLFAIAAIPSYSLEEEPDNVPEESRSVLSLDDCLDIAYDQNISLQRALIGIELSALDRIRSEAYIDAGFETDFTVQGSENSDPAATMDSTCQIDWGAKYNLPSWNGSSWVFSLGQVRSSSDIVGGDGPGNITSYTSQIGLAYNYPLMEGQGTRVNRIGVERSELSFIRSEIAVEETKRNLRYGIIQAYIQAVLAQRQIDVLNVSLGTAENLVDEVTARINVGQLAPYELLASQAGLAERQESLINSESRYSTVLDSLKELIGMPLTDEIDVDPSILVPVYLDINPDELYIIAQRNRGDLQDLDLQIQQAQLDLVLAEDKRQHNLTWSTVLGLAGEDDAYTSSISDMQDFSWYTGLQYNIQLGGNRRDEADYETILLITEQLELDRVDFLRRLQLDIRSAHEDLRNALLRIDVTDQGLDVQEIKMENELLRMEMGLITSRDLLEFDLELANAKLSRDNAIADALNAIARLEFLTAQLLMDDAVVLADITHESEDAE